MPEVISIIVEPGDIELSGKLGSYDYSLSSIFITSDSTVNIDVTASLTGDVAFFESCLLIADNHEPSWPFPKTMTPNGNIQYALGLDLTGETVTGTHSAILTFWATATP